MKIKFMDGPKAGTVIESSRRNISIPVKINGMAKFYSEQQECPLRTSFDVVEYKVHEYRLFQTNEHESFSATAHLAYCGERDKSPRGKLPFEFKTTKRPVPDFIDDFEGWWRRMLWDHKVIQDRSTAALIKHWEDEKQFIVESLS